MHGHKQRSLYKTCMLEASVPLIVIKKYWIIQHEFLSLYLLALLLSNTAGTPLFMKGSTSLMRRNNDIMEGHRGKHNKGMTHHNQPSHCSRQTIMAGAIITETYSQVMVVWIYRCKHIREKEKKGKQGRVTGCCIRGFFWFVEMLSWKVKLLSLELNIP